MEIINKEYVKVSKFDIFTYQVKCSNSNNKESLEFFQRLFRIILDYEKKHKCFIEYICIKLDSKCIKSFIKNEKLTLSRQTLLNSIVFAVMNNNFYIAKELKKFIHKNEICREELDYLGGFVLNNSISIHEFYNGEREKYIFNDLTNQIEKGFIFEKNIKDKKFNTNVETKTIFIEKSYMVAAIMKINRKYLNKNYISKRELNVLTWDMQKRFNEQNINALFVDDIDYSYFADCGDTIMLNDNYIYDFEGVEQRFQAHLPIEILSIIWDENLMSSNVIDNFQNVLKENCKSLTKNKNSKE